MRLAVHGARDRAAVPLSRRGKGEGWSSFSKTLPTLCRVYQFNCGNTTVISLEELEEGSLENPNELQAFQSVGKPQESLKREFESKKATRKALRASLLL